MEKFAELCAVFLGALLIKLEERGVLEKVATALVQAWVRNSQPQMIIPAASNKEDDEFIKAAEKDGWGRDMPRPVHP